MLDYLIAIAPVSLLAAGLLLRVPKTSVSLRIAVLILLFIVARDSMGPHGFWQLTASSLTLTAPVGTLLSLATICLGLCLYVLRFEKASCAALRWWVPGKFWRCVAWGLAGAGGIGLTVCLLKLATGLPRSQPSPGLSGGALLIFALLGNALEELLFRGIVQARLALRVAPWRAIALSALLFSACHAWLALMNPGASLSIMVFTLIEGVVAGVVYWRAGLIAAVLTHGLAIHGLAMGFY